MIKDYYRVLDVDPTASLEKIKAAYRRKALELHPDRNGGSHAAEEAFKEAAEAYAVLGDPERRASYDARRSRGAESSGEAFEPGDLFSELFTRSGFEAVFSQLAQEFERQGLRFDENYLRRVFAGSKGQAVFGGFVFVWPFGNLFQFLGGTGTRPFGLHRSKPQVAPRKTGIVGRLLRSALPRPPGRVTTQADIRYILPVGSDTLQRGGRVRVTVPGPTGSETYDVKIPAGARPGTKLRLPGRGGGGLPRRGDLFLEIRHRA